ncbi:MAG: BadF/BadG/BcrA/BcrD ATPase family protein [Dysgonomonas sp.]
MILIADGGSTKVDWRLIDKGVGIKQIFTGGMNPFFRTQEDVSEEIRHNLLPQVKEFNIERIYFFGAGCNSAEKNQIISNAITDNIKCSYVEVNSDLLAAARGLCGKDKGIACIIGTGSNSCYYDGDDIISNISPLGYILGDEGSGAVIGRLFIGACLKNQLTSGLKEKFLNEYNLTPVSILDKVYKQPMPNRFLAGLSPFIHSHIEDETIYNLVYNTFKDFLVRNVMQYDNHKQLPVHFTGSVAYHYQAVLRKVLSELDITVGNITQSPMEGLIQYYSEIKSI